MKQKIAILMVAMISITSLIGNPVATFAAQTFQNEQLDSEVLQTELDEYNTDAITDKSSNSNSLEKEETIPSNITSIEKELALSSSYIGVSGTEVASASIGDDVTGTVYQNGNEYTLEITGSGLQINKSLRNLSEFKNYYEKITNIVYTAEINTIGASAFRDFKSLKSIVIPTTIIKVGDNAFMNCQNANSLVFEDSNLSLEIGGYAFKECKSIPAVEIPKRLYKTNAVNGIFSNCSSLTTASIEEGSTNIPDGLFRDAKTLQYVTLPDSIEKIGVSAFRDCESLKEIRIPKNVTNIGGSAYKGCVSATTLVFDEGTVSLDIDAAAFNGCTSIQTVAIPKRLKSTNSVNSTFANCSSLKTASIEEGSTNIPDGLFRDAKALQYVTLPDSIEKIGGSAFRDCESLKEIRIPKNVTNIGGSAYKGCTSAATLIFDKGTVSLSIEGGAFTECTSIQTVEIPKRLESVDSIYGIFSHCSSLRNASLENGSVIIPNGLFLDAISLKTVTIPISLSKVGNKGFYGCEGLKDVYYAGTEAQWKNVTIEDKNDPLLNATFHYSENPLTELKIDQKDATITVGSTIQLTYSTIPKDATDEATWTSSSDTIATVSDTGLVTAVAEGKARITVSIGNVSDTIELTIVDGDIKVTSLSLNKTELTLEPKQTEQLILTVTPKNATETIKWNSNDASIVDVNQNGLVSAVKEGKTSVTASTEDGLVSTTCIVTVINKDIPDKNTDLDNSEIPKEEVASIKKSLQENTSPVLWIYGLKESYEYFGAPVEPNVDVYYGETRLHLNKEYSISYKNNKSAGEGTIIINGKGNYKGKISKSFQIVQSKTGSSSIKKMAVSGLEKSYVFTGSPIVPNIKVGTLEQGKDYTVNISKNQDVGTAKVVISGIGDYTDSITKTFQIKPLDISLISAKLDITWSNTDYQAGGAKPTATIIYNISDEKELNLRDGIDYKLTYKYNTTMGNSTVIINGLGNFTKNLTKQVMLTQLDKSDIVISAPDVKANIKQGGTYFQSKLKLYTLDGKLLKNNKDYTLSYYDTNQRCLIDKTTPKGVVQSGDKILVTITPGSSGTISKPIEATYNIVDTVKDLSKVKVQIPSQTYIGLPICPEIMISGLVNGTDYQVVAYANNINKGSARVFLSGINTYSGIKLATFKIVVANDSDIYGGAWNGKEFITD